MTVSLLGYTPKQAERIQRALEMDMARIEDIVYRMRHRLSDLGEERHRADTLLEQLREWKYSLDAIVERRTRRP